MANSSVDLWWYSDGYKYNLCQTTNRFSNGQEVKLTGRADITTYRPQVAFPFLPVRPFIPMVTNGLLELGVSLFGIGEANFSARITSVADFPGVANWVQLIKRDGTYQFTHTDGQFWLDNDPFYNTDGVGGPNINTDVKPIGVITFDDHPYVSVSSLPFSATSIEDHFKTYLVFKPDPQDSSIWVTLGMVDWAWSGTEATAWNTKTLTSSWTDGPHYTYSIDEFPSWLYVLHNNY